MVALTQLELFEYPLLTQKNIKHLKINEISEKNEESTPKTFKALLRETSVYKYYVELKEDVFTEQGFLDVAKVPSLRLSGAGQFFKNLRIKANFSQKVVAKILNVSRSQVRHWENNNANMPLFALIKLGEVRDISRDTIYELIDQGNFKTKINLPVKFEKIQNIIQSFSPHKSNVNCQVYVFRHSIEDLSKIKGTLNVNPMFYDNNKKIKISSNELYHYLTTFFRYTKVSKIHPPLTREVKHWHDKGVDLKRAIICPCLQSDGYMSHRDNSISFSGKIKSLHDYFVDAMYFEYNLLPTSYLTRCGHKDCFTTSYWPESLKIVEEIINLAGSTKTSPAKGQTIDEYLNEPQPHLAYLINANEIEQKIALRIWASTEGSIHLVLINDGRLKPLFDISCAHPDLATQLQQIAERFNIKFHLKSSKKNWSGIAMLRNSTISGCISFLKLGNFIKYSKIGANSIYHKGLDKDVLMLGILEFKIRQKTNPNLRKLPMKEVRYRINKIIENRNYKSASYYIDYFS